MEDDLNFLKMEDDLNFFESGRRPIFFWKWKMPTIFFKKEDDLKQIMQPKTIKIKTKIKTLVVAPLW